MTPWFKEHRFGNTDTIANTNSCGAKVGNGAHGVDNILALHCIEDLAATKADV